MCMGTDDHLFLFVRFRKFLQIFVTMDEGCIMVGIMDVS